MTASYSRDCQTPPKNLLPEQLKNHKTKTRTPEICLLGKYNKYKKHFRLRRKPAGFLARLLGLATAARAARARRIDRNHDG